MMLIDRPRHELAQTYGEMICPSFECSVETTDGDRQAAEAGAGVPRVVERSIEPSRRQNHSLYRPELDCCRCTSSILEMSSELQYLGIIYDASPAARLGIYLEHLKYHLSDPGYIRCFYRRSALR